MEGKRLFRHIQVIYFTKETEEAVLEVLRVGNMTGTDVTKKFEEEYAAWNKMKYALGHSTGTGALYGAMFGLGIGKWDEIICPSITYWVSCLPVFSLGGTVVFADRICDWLGKLDSVPMV